MGRSHRIVARRLTRPASAARPARSALAPITALVALVVMTALGACTANDSPSPTPGTPSTPGRGGSIRLLSDRAFTTWDPQRMYGGQEAAIAVRTITRTLTGYPAGGVGGVAALRGDLATTTGTPSDNGRVWTFTLRQDAQWEDGRAVTCQDVKYGVSRTFDRALAAGSAPYARTLLDIPRTVDPTGADLSAYAGPYVGSGQELFDEAVKCSGQDITFKLKVAVHDFPQIVALPIFAPARADKDGRERSALDVFSCGPYRMDGPWEAGAGGRLVRNAHWDPSSDPLRSAFPDVIEIRDGIPVATILSRLVDDKAPDNTAIGLADIPQSAAADALKDPGFAARVSRPPSGTVEYLLPNFRSAAMGDSTIRQAFAMATDREAFAAAYGPGTMLPRYAVLSATLPAAPTQGPWGTPLAGDVDAARGVLTAANIPLPVPVRVAYRSSPVADAAFAAMRSRWEAAGFAVTLTGLGDNYYTTISTPGAETAYDVFRAAWFADYPSGEAVIPPLFDGRSNLAGARRGADYGYFNDATISTGIEAASGLADQTAREAAWGALDVAVAKAGGHIALAERTRLYARGSAVTAYAENPFLGGYVDLAGIGARQ